jgi:GxxExxY protein
VAEILYPEESYAIMGACFNVYKDKGPGFREPVYQECMELELEFQRIPFDAKRELRLEYRGKTLTSKHIPDLVCYEKIIVELKALSQLTDEHRAQVLDYLKASGLQLGLLVNFGRYPDLEWERIVLTKPTGGAQRPTPRPDGKRARLPRPG